METITNSLEMEFQASEGANVKVTLYDQKSDLTAETVQDAMMNMVDLEVLVNADGHLMDGAYGAKTIRKIENQLF
ncbi:MAG: DUF2922 domain-containing protein [Peptococcaceae bacterium]|nr:DUF2922 domain-containing protein [Peptococcaceae bacterium]MBR0447954.1 DUF2922 domain-containing protein [Peptococcaceae bacterium]